MSAICEHMDEICALVEKAARWVNVDYAPRVWFASICRGRVNTRPLPLLEFCFQAVGEHKALSVGSRQGALPLHHLAVMNAHFGNYSSEPEGETGMWCVSLDVASADEFRELSRTPVLWVIPFSRPDRLIPAFEAVSARFGATGLSAPLFMKAALLELFGMLLNEMTGARAGSRQTMPSAVEAAIRHMQGRYTHAALSLNDIAGAAGLSVDHFGRLFHAATGLTPMRYLRRLRVLRSRNLLDRTRLRVSEVAYETGFQDPLHFSRVFRLETGQSPLSYRRHPTQPT